MLKQLFVSEYRTEEREAFYQPPPKSPTHLSSTLTQRRNYAKLASLSFPPANRAISSSFRSVMIREGLVVEER